MSLKHGSNFEYIRIMLGHGDIRTIQNAYLHVASEDIAKSSKKTSPVANPGLRKSNGHPVKSVSNGNIANHRNERIIVVNVQNEEPGGIMAVSYYAKNNQKVKDPTRQRGKGPYRSTASRRPPLPPLVGRQASRRVPMREPVKTQATTRSIVRRAV